MDALIIEPSKETPRVSFNPNSGKLSISGRSLPEDAIAFYKKIFDWVNVYSQSPGPLTVLDVNLEYYNTATSKQLYKLLCMLEELGKKHKVEVTWKYNKEDADMLAQGERFSKLVLLKFNLVEA